MLVESRLSCRDALPRAAGFFVFGDKRRPAIYYLCSETPQEKEGQMPETDGKRVKMLVINVGREDRDALASIMERHGHKVKSGGVRLALRMADRADPASDHVQRVMLRIRNESLPGTPDNVAFFRGVTRMPVKLEPHDMALLRKIKRVFKAKDFAKAIRAAIRWLEAVESQG